MVQIKVEQATIDQNQTPLLVVGVYENENEFHIQKDLTQYYIIPSRKSYQTKSSKLS